MPTIEADYRAVTPMFCAGADPNRPELRVPSFKGVLRFWWRALAWADSGDDLEAIHEKEEQLFGGPQKGNGMAMRIVAIQPQSVKLAAQDKLGARYLAYGVTERTGLQAPFDFTVRLDCREDPDESRICRALQALGLFGGMGARSRRGYGSTVLKELRIDGERCWSCPKDVAALRQAIEQLIPRETPMPLPEYTAFHKQSRVAVITANRSEPMQMLDLVGREMVRFRSWGRGGKVLGSVPSERNFQDDHDLMYLSPQQRASHPQRIAFGLPHNYGKGPNKQVGPARDDLDRRASPLFIHIHACEDKAVAAVLSFLPSRFLPEGTKIDVGGAQVELAADSELWKPIHAFLDRFANHSYKENFTDVVEVRR